MNDFSDYLARESGEKTAAIATSKALVREYAERNSQMLKELAASLINAGVPAKPMYVLDRAEPVLGIFGRHRYSKEYYKTVGNGWVIHSHYRDDYTPYPGYVLSETGVVYRFEEAYFGRENEVYGIDLRLKNHFSEYILGKLTRLNDFAFNIGASHNHLGIVNQLPSQDVLEQFIQLQMESLAYHYHRLTGT